MSNYERVLPTVFPYLVECDKEQARYLVLELTSLERVDCPMGSSFAIVSGITSGTIGLWLSGVSYNYLNKRFAQMQRNVGCMRNFSMPARRNYGDIDF
jgi:hypothetical protein